MSDTDIHDGESAFETFVERELTGLASRARDERICLDCLGGRLVVEFVAGLARTGCSPQAILEMVVEGLDGAEEDEPRGGQGRSRPIH